MYVVDIVLLFCMHNCIALRIDLDFRSMHYLKFDIIFTYYYII